MGKTTMNPAVQTPSRNRRKVAVGVVTSAKMEKTIVVKIPRLVPHRDYGKYLRRFTVCKAHDEKREAAVGDTVRIVETRPLSRTKRWRLLEIVSRSNRTPEPGNPAGDGPAAPPAR